MNAIQNALKIAAQKQIEYRNQANIASRDALLVWEAQLSGLMENIEEWIQPLYDLDGFIAEAKKCSYLATDSSGRDAEREGTSLRLWFADTSLLISPQHIKVDSNLSTATGSVEVYGEGMVAPYEITYINGHFDSIRRQGNNLSFGELTFNQILAAEVPGLKPTILEA
ncbi:hypothetical protein [Pseudomonas viridiflava]|uniref:hypothetical protein n=1 Tax=Pseudomonas viridiflava TaxID=33069 RepID=UPI002EA86542|nr:hypothetical protein [Pseudomonas viridiflava]